ncbi:MAG TPA: TetR/AcrR family transcriptional regulator [Vicinamibacterales bacterium]|jgi:AcrR family transcriptional regulator|nr:TetR/AcrR family transcriptional regulator [Vicinamibacterales bacterium]
MIGDVGRPKEHDEETRAALRAATEKVVTELGVGAFSVRGVAREVGTTTRAVYSLFGSKEGLLVDALAQSAYAFLADGMSELPATDDPVADLVSVGVVFRALVLEHPAPYRIAFQRITPGFHAGPEVVEARERALAGLLRRVERLADAGLLVDKPVFEAAVEFNAMLEGLANAELRGTVFPTLAAGDEERTWREALLTVVRGFRAP